MRKYIPNLWALFGSLPNKKRFVRDFAFNLLLTILLCLFAPMKVWVIVLMVIYVLTPIAGMFVTCRYIALHGAENKQFFREWRAHNRAVKRPDLPLTMLEYIQLRERSIPKKRQFTPHRWFIQSGRKESDAIMYGMRVHRIYNWENNNLREERKHLIDVDTWRSYSGRYTVASACHERNALQDFRRSY